jgi:hypothetical protein
MRKFSIMPALMAALGMQRQMMAPAEALQKLAGLGSTMRRSRKSKGLGKPSYAKGNNRNAHWGANSPNGARAVARRVRQIERGVLRAENGLAA